MFAKDLTATGQVRVKICGITTFADALVAIHGGADAIGFVLFPGSKRYVDVRLASDWMINLPHDITKVAVLVNPTWDDVIKTADWPFIDALQFHGHESPEFCRRVAEEGIRFAKAIPVTRMGPLLQVADFFTDTVVLDSSSDQGFGGSGEAFDWPTGRKFVEEHSSLRVVVAGGLTPENVGEAVRAIRPFGVDVTTGVESAPGRKDPRRVRDFVSAVRGL